MVGKDLEAAWAELTATWGDERAHRAFLDRFGDLDGLAVAGRHYREALAARPDDPVARRGRDEVVKRATVIAMAQLPRTAPPRQLLGKGARRWAALALGTWAAGALLWFLGGRLGWFR